MDTTRSLTDSPVDNPLDTPPHRDQYGVGPRPEQSPLPLDLAQWLVRRRNDGTTPAAISDELVRNGWDADSAARVSLRSLRSADRQSLTYAVSTTSAGVAALSAASSAHLMIAGNPRPLDLTLTLTVFLVAAPIAVVATLAAARAERRSEFVMWSPTRRGWFGALALCTATVGLARLLAYLYSAIATLTGASQDDFDLAAAGQVATTLAVAIPLFVWSFREWRRSNLVISALSSDDDGDAGKR